MTTKSAWSTIGAWAAEAERADEEEKEAAEHAAAEAAVSKAAQPPPASFPSLKDSVTAAGKQKKKTKMTLQEFTMGNSFNSGSSSRLTPAEMMRLPTRPQERGDEMHGGIGGGFSGYGSYGGRGGGGGGGGRIRDYGDSDGGRKGYGGFGEDDRRRGSPRVSEFDSMMPSRADEVDNWGAMKRSPMPSFDSGRGMGSSGPAARPARYSDLGGGGGGGFSKADEVDNWGSMKKVQAAPPPSGQLGSRSSFGSGFRNDSLPPGGEPERWTKSSSFSKDQEAPVIVKVNKPNPFGAARPREEVLTEKGVDWKKLDEEIGVKKVAGISRPTSSHSSRPGSSQSVRSDGAALQQQRPQEGAMEVPVVKPKPKVNPFGDAKPREVALAEKGLDWRKIDLDLEHKRLDRPETDEENNLKEEIENLKKDSLQKSDEEQANFHDEIIKKEKELELLIRQLDDKVRFGQKNNDRPGSGSGRYTGPPARISSQHVPSEDPRAAVEFMDRPRSRGTVESFPRQNDDRRNFSGGRDRGGFPGSRELDRSSPRNRW